MGPDATILVFLMFKPAFSLSSFIFIKRLFSSSLLSAMSVMSSAYLRLLIFLPEVLIPACASSSPACCMTYSACKLNKQGDNTQPWCTPFPIWTQSIVPCLILTVASWPTCRFLGFPLDDVVTRTRAGGGSWDDRQKVPKTVTYTFTVRFAWLTAGTLLLVCRTPSGLAVHHGQDTTGTTMDVTSEWFRGLHSCQLWGGMIVPYYLVFSSLFVLSTLVCSTLFFFSLHLYHILRIADLSSGEFCHVP